MRSLILPLAALASLPFAAAPLHADPSRELVVALAPPRPGAGPALRSARLAERTAALGLAWRGTLADGLSLVHGATAGPRSNPFDLDPSRVWRIEARDSAAAAAALDSLDGDPDVEWVEQNRRRTPAVVSIVPAPTPLPDAATLDPGFPNDPMFRDTRQWALRNAGPGSAYNGVAGADIHALAAWSVTTGSNDVRLAIADTGVDPDHPELQVRLPDGSMRLELGMNVTNDPSPSFADSFGHGAGVVGLMAARTNEGPHFDSLGVAGVCGGDGHANYGCHIVPIKIAPGHSGDATSFDVARAIVYSADVGARAMNISFTGDGPSRLERLAMYYAITRGCVVVAASGNLGFIPGRAREYPAAYAEEGFGISVGATDNRDRRAAFSSYGPGLDLLAPGVNNWTTYMTYAGFGGLRRNGYVVGSGTSFAAPHVAGVVGLLAAVRPELTDNDFQRIIRESADDLGAPGPDTLTGWGRVNAARALEAVRPSLGVWHDEVPGTVSPTGRTGTLTVGESGPGVMDRVRLWPDAQLLEVRAAIAFPDSFLDSIRVWPRVGGTMAVRGDFNLRYFAPWAELVSQDAATFTLRGYLYRQAEAQCDPCGDDAYLPLPPDQARFGFTVIGRVDRPPTLHVSSPAAGARFAPGDTATLGFDARDPDLVSAIEVWLDPEGEPSVRIARLPGDATSARLVVPCAAMAGGGATLRVRALDEHGRQHDETSVAVPVTLAPAPCGAAATRVRVAPNPFRGAARIVVPGRGRVDIMDAAGRIVRSVPVEPPAAYFDWDGRDDRGRTLGPGLYFARYQGAAGRSLQKLIKLDPESVGPGRP